MVVNVRTDGAGNVFIGGSDDTKSTAQDAIDSIDSFLTQMRSNNWRDASRASSITTTNILTNYQIEWCPNNIFFSSETLTAGLVNFAAGSAITNSGARFRSTLFQSRSWVRTSSVVSFTAATLHSSLFGSNVSYKVVADKHGIIGYYRAGSTITVTWTGLLSNVKGVFTQYGGNFAHVGFSDMQQVFSKTLRIGAATIIPLLNPSNVNAIYPVVCANGNTPNSFLWATDFYVKENNLTFNYPVVGKINNFLLGVGSGFELGKYYSLGVEDVVGASKVFQCAYPLGNFRYILVRVLEG